MGAQLYLRGAVEEDVPGGGIGREGRQQRQRFAEPLHPRHLCTAEHRDRKHGAQQRRGLRRSFPKSVYNSDDASPHRIAGCFAIVAPWQASLARPPCRPPLDAAHACNARHWMLLDQHDMRPGRLYTRSASFNGRGLAAAATARQLIFEPMRELINADGRRDHRASPSASGRAPAHLSRHRVGHTSRGSHWVTAVVAMVSGSPK